MNGCGVSVAISYILGILTALIVFASDRHDR
jgi:hypothetical protein